MGKIVLVPIANGIEELEAVAIIDILRRGGLSVRISSIADRQVTCANGVKIVADSDFVNESISNYDAIILPGGSRGAENFSEYPELVFALKEFVKNNKLIGAICASPAVVLARHGLLDDIKATGYPSLKNQIKNYQDEKVVLDKNIITSQGPATAIDFGLKIVEILSSLEKAQSVAQQILRA